MINQYKGWAFHSLLLPRRRCSKLARNIFLKHKTCSILHKDRARKVTTIRAPNLDPEQEGTMFPERPLLSLNDPSHLVLPCEAIQGNIGPHHRIHTLAASSVLAHNHRHPRI